MITERRRGVRTRGRSYKLIADEARRCRTAILPDAGPDAPLSAIALFERLNTYVVTVNGRQIALDPDVKRFPLELEAATFYEPKSDVIKVVLAERTYNSLEFGDPRASFTVLHETGHIVLHASELVRMTTIPGVANALHRSREEHPIYEDTEWQADTFASRMWMPVQGIMRLEAQRGCVTTTMLVHEYGVSNAAAEHRLRQYRAGKG
jgi:hypothetical protein